MPELPLVLPACDEAGVDALPIFLRLAGRPCILAGEGEGAAAKRRLLERAGAVIVGEAGTAKLAIVAIEEEAAALAAVERLRARGVLVNAVDRPELCDWTLPAIVDRDPLLVAVGTGGRSAGLAAALRQRLELLLPADLGRRADRLHAARGRLRVRYPEPGERRRAIADALGPGGPLDLLAPAAPDERWIEEPAMSGAPRIERIRLRSPDPDELTLREARLMANADRVYHAAGVPPAILARVRADAERCAGEPPAMPAGGLTVVIEAGW